MFVDTANALFYTSSLIGVLLILFHHMHPS
jgi:hypothetical protein